MIINAGVEANFGQVVCCALALTWKHPQRPPFGYTRIGSWEPRAVVMRSGRSERFQDSDLLVGIHPRLTRRSNGIPVNPTYSV